MPNDTPKLPGYELRGVIGEGAFGIVYLARQLSTGQSVAVMPLRRDEGTFLGDIIFCAEKKTRRGRLRQTLREPRIPRENRTWLVPRSERSTLLFS